MVQIEKKHSKVKKINYKKLETQSYIKSPLFSNEDIYLLSAMRSHTVRDIKCNVPTKFREDLLCPLKCWSSCEQPIFDTQEHLFKCTKILAKLETNILTSDEIIHDHIFENVEKQKAATALFRDLLEQREQLCNEETANQLLYTGPFAPNSAV